MFSIQIDPAAALKETVDFNRKLLKGTKFSYKAERGHVEAVAMLIAAGTDLDHINRLGGSYSMEAVKYFLDRSFYDCVDRIDGCPYALFVRAGNDGTGAITSMRRILKGLAVREVQEPLLIAGDFDTARLAECEELGLTMAAGLEAGVF